jgi:hypothetical protein
VDAEASAAAGESVPSGLTREQILQCTGEAVFPHLRPELVDQKECPICQIEFEDGEVLRAFHCFHLFHLNCTSRRREEEEEEEEQEEDDDEEITAIVIYTHPAQTRLKCPHTPRLDSA